MKRLALLLAALFVLPADAAVRATLDTATGRIDIHDTTGPCTAPARYAEFIPRDGGKPIGGCWRPAEDDDVPQLWVVFFDTDTARVLIRSLRQPNNP